MGELLLERDPNAVQQDGTANAPPPHNPFPPALRAPAKARIQHEQQALRAEVEKEAKEQVRWTPPMT